MAQGNESATFQVNLAGNAADVAKTTAGAMSDLRKRIDEQSGAMKLLQGTYKSLKGSTEDIKQAKAALKGRIDALKDSVKANNTALKSQQVGLRASSDAAKKLKETSKDLQAALEKTKKEYGELTEKRKKIAADNLKNKIDGDARSSEYLSGAAMGLVTVLAAVAAGFISAGIAAAKFVLHGADAARSMGLLRQAAMGGNAQWGKNAGEQIDALARKVPTSKAEIDKLGNSLAKSRIGGQLWVDTLNAVTQASAALGDDAGGKIQEFITRGRQMGRLQINPLEMIGTGIDFKDVAEALSKSMHVGVKDATQALFEGRVKLADGAAALRAAVEKKVGGINLRQMLSFDNLVKKLGESFDELTKGIDLEPMLKGFKEIANIFSITTTSGQALKQIVEVFGKELTGAFVSTTPLAKKLVYGIIIGAQEIVIAYLKVKKSLKEAFGDVEVTKNIDLVKTGIMGVRVAVGAAAVAMGAFLAAGGLLYNTYVKPFADLASSLSFLGTGFKLQYDAIANLDWGGLGSAVVNGLINGVKAQAGALADVVKGLGKRIKSVFSGEMDIHSPSREMAKLGKQLPAGIVQGANEGQAELDTKIGAMVTVPSAGGGGGRAAAPSVVVNVTINASGADAKQVAAAVASDSVIEQFTKIILNAVQGGGVPVPA